MIITKRITLFLLLLAIPVFLVSAQTSNTNANFFDLSGAPQWVRDLRRWEIVAFGAIPFAMFTATFGMDMYRWNETNGMDWSDNGRKYAPWPMKSAGAIAMDYKEMEKTLVIAASLAVSVACVDLVITQIKRHKARKRIESLPHNATTIERRPLYPDTPEAPPPPEAQPQAPTTPEAKDDAAGSLEAPPQAAPSS